MTQQTTNWPPPYSIIRSNRAKYIRLQIHPRKGLCLIIPAQQNEQDALKFMQSKKAWILKHLNSQSIIPEKTQSLPNSIDLKCTGNLWQLEYLPAKQCKLYCNQYDKKIILACDQKKQELIYRKLQNWLVAEAETELLDRLYTISKKTKLTYSALQVRRQKRIWGSCSNDKKISLNARLLFLPSEHVDYVIIHELCHTRFFDHSTKFWNLVGSFCPDYKKLKSEIQQLESLVPEWA